MATPPLSVVGDVVAATFAVLIGSSFIIVPFVVQVWFLLVGRTFITVMVRIDPIGPTIFLIATPTKILTGGSGGGGCCTGVVLGSGQGSGAVMGINLVLETCSAALHHGNGCSGSRIRSTTTNSVDGIGDRGDSVVGLEGHNIGRHSRQVIMDINMIRFQVSDMDKKMCHICAMITISIDIAVLFAIEFSERDPIFFVSVVMRLDFQIPFGGNAMEVLCSQVS